MNTSTRIRIVNSRLLIIFAFFLYSSNCLSAQESPDCTNDILRPTPICLNTHENVELPSNGQIALWAVDFDESSFDDCDETLDFRIWYADMAASGYPDQSGDWRLPDLSSSGADVLAYLPTSAIFFCEQTNGQSRTFAVRIYVVDDAGNWDYCESKVTIEDKDDVCPSMSHVIAGNCRTEGGNGLSDVVTTLKGGFNGTEVREGSDDFEFIVAGGYDWEVTAEKDDSYLNGLTAQDLSLIYRHVSGIEYLNSNYKLLAADANSDRDIDIRDVLELKKLLLGLSSELPQTKAWKFIDKRYDFSGVTNNSLPDDVDDAQTIKYEQISTNHLNTDFIAVQIGNVDKDAGVVGGEERDGETLTFTMPSTDFSDGEVVTVDVTADNFHEITAYQMTIEFNNGVLEYIGSTGGVLNLNEGDFGSFAADRGYVSTLWHNTNAQSVANNEVLFSLTFRATAAGQLRDVISIGSTITPAIAFRNGEDIDVDLDFVAEDGGTFANAFVLLQNTPNPFINKTSIGYVLPEAAEVNLTVFTIDGKILKSARAMGKRGINYFEFENFDLPTSSVLYYQLNTEGFIATKKMIVQN